MNVKLGISLTFGIIEKMIGTVDNKYKVNFISLVSLNSFLEE